MAGSRHWGGVRSAVSRSPPTEWELVVDEKLKPTREQLRKQPEEAVREGQDRRYLVEVYLGDKIAKNSSGKPFPAARGIYVDVDLELGVGRTTSLRRDPDAERGVRFHDDAELPSVIGADPEVGVPVPDELVERYAAVLEEAHGVAPGRGGDLDG